MSSIIIILYFIFGLLSLVLFFKIWAMTNRISEIRDEFEDTKQILLDAHFGNFNLKGKQPGDKVIYRNDAKEYIVTGISFSQGTYCLNLHKEEKFLSEIPYTKVLNTEEEQALRKTIATGAKFKVSNNYYGNTVVEIIQVPEEDGICTIRNSNNKEYKIKYTQLRPL